MAEHNRNTRYAYLDQFSTEQLEEILRADIESPGSGDDEAIFYILEVIERRERENPTGRLVDPDEAWAEFQACYNTPEGEGLSLYPTGDGEARKPIPIQPAPKRKRRTLRRILIAAAIVGALAVLAVPSALGFANLFEMIGQWTGTDFQFKPTRAHTEMLSPVSGDIVTGAFEDIPPALAACQITDPVIPSYLPDGFALKAVEVYSASDFGTNDVNIFYEDAEGQYLSIQIVQHLSATGDSSIYEKDNASVIIHTVGGISHYIMKNHKNCTATWYTNQLECSISTSLAQDDLTQIIDSIYKEKSST